jgi:hypothetical protein
MRSVIIKAVLLGTITTTVLLLGQVTIPHDKRTRGLKAENGLIITWLAGGITDADANQVDIFDDNGILVTSLNVLRPVEGARQAFIYDVSGRPGSLIAVAAVYESKEKEFSPAAALLIFDTRGRLLSAHALDPTNLVVRLVVDENSNIWTLTHNFIDNKTPPTAPIVVEYTSDGKIVRELLALSDLFSQGGQPKQSLANGIITMGYEAGVVWIWLPGSTALVTISASGGNVKIVQTGLAKSDTYKEVPLDITRDSTGDIIEFAREESKGAGYNVSYFAWSSSTGQWSRFTPGECEGARILGTGDGGLIFALWGPNSHKKVICSYRR